MKKLLTYSLVFIALILVITGCKSQPGVSPTNQHSHKKNFSIETVVNDVTTEIGINNPIPIDDESMDQFIMACYTDADIEIPITLEDITEYYGLMCTSNVSSDFVLGIRTSSEKQQYVVDVLEAIRSTREKCFDGYIDAEYQKAYSARVLVAGDYTFLAILGNPEGGAEENARKVENLIMSYFDQKEW